MSDTDPLLYGGAAARRAGIKAGTWRSYVHRGYAPLPDDPDDSDPDVPKHQRRPRWRTSTVDAHIARTKTQGKRTELVEARRQDQQRRRAELAEQQSPKAAAGKIWITRNERALIDAAGDLVDYRDELLDALPDHRDALAAAIDSAGEHMTPPATYTLAGAVSYALCWVADLPDYHPAREPLARHRRLRTEYETFRESPNVI